MAIRITRTESLLRLELEGVLSIRQAAEEARLLAASLDGAPAVEIETSALQDADTAILQLLCSLKKSVPELRFASPSAGFLAAVERCGLTSELLAGYREGA